MVDKEELVKVWPREACSCGKGNVPGKRKQGEEPPTEGKEHSRNRITGCSGEHTLLISDFQFTVNLELKNHGCWNCV